MPGNQQMAVSIPEPMPYFFLDYTPEMVNICAGGLDEVAESLWLCARFRH
jgi:hypothetical protein